MDETMMDSDEVILADQVETDPYAGMSQLDRIEYKLDQILTLKAELETVIMSEVFPMLEKFKQGGILGLMSMMK